MAKKSKNKRKGMPVVSLFCGAGGLDKGFLKGGFNPVVAFDHAPYAVTTYKKNFPESDAHAVDISRLTKKRFLEYLHEAIPKGRRIGLIAGPPCQGFSRANNLSGPNDPRNKLITKYINLAIAAQKDYSVAFIVMENVSTLNRAAHADRLKFIRNKLEKSGFDVHDDVLNSARFGVPQVRERFFFVAIKKQLPRAKKFKFPSGTSEKKTVADAIRGLPSPTTIKQFRKGKRNKEHPNHWTMTPKSEKFTNRRFPKNGRSFIKLTWGKPSRTVAYGHREIHVHPNGRRRLSIYEAMLIQGFPKGFVLKGTLSEQVTMVSNAVPPKLSRSVASAVAKVL